MPETRDEHTAFTVIAHRGASGYLPEHTLESAQLALQQGADYIEQDLVLSKDGVLLVLHDIHIETVTNVESIFPSRHREDGRFYAIDFSLSEIQQLNVHERQDGQQQQVYASRYSGNGKFKVATFEEQILLIQKFNQDNQLSIGLYPEIKSPQWHLSEGQDIALAAIEVLRKYGLDDANKNIFLQSFDPLSLKHLRYNLHSRVKQVQLLAENEWAESTADYDYLKTSNGLADISTYAVGIGPWIPQLYDFDNGIRTELTQEAKAHGLLIHPYTFRSDDLPTNTSVEALMSLLIDDLKVDGVFTDQSDVVIQWLQKNQKR